jgi:NAD(P)-dependent dehydrogenase (short-subunit alcohol dehydrogenase family)
MEASDSNSSLLHPLSLDITSPSSISSFFDEVSSSTSSVHALVNNAVKTVTMMMIARFRLFWNDEWNGMAHTGMI